MKEEGIQYFFMDAHGILFGSPRPRYGVFAPARTPAVVVAKLHSGIAALLKLPDVQQRLTAEGAVAIGNSPEQFAAQIKGDIAKWGKVVQESGLQIE